MPNYNPLPLAFRKVWRDLWKNKGRTLLVVCSIAIGVLALGLVNSGNILLARQMKISQAASQPSHAILYLTGLIDDDTVHALSRLPEVADAEGIVNSSIRWKPTLEADWQDANLIARDDYERQLHDLVTLKTGHWPDSNSVSVEFNHVLPYGVPATGQTIYIEVNNRPKAVTLGGTVRDPWQFPPPFNQNPTFYATREMVAALGGYPYYSELHLTVPQYSQALTEKAVDGVEKKLNKMGLGVGYVMINDPQRHFLQNMMDGVGMVLTVMSVLSLGLSTILVINTINAIVAQQVPQIGIMKTVGGLSAQIATLYLAGVTIYSLVSLLVAVPVGALGGDLMARWMMGLINIPTAPLEVLPQVLLVQIGAGLVTPLLAALWPVFQGVTISVRQAISAYGVGTGQYGSRMMDKLLGRVQGLPRMLTLSLRNTFRRTGRVILTEITLIAAGAAFMMVISAQYSFDESIARLFLSLGYEVQVNFDQPQRISKIIPLIESRPNISRAEIWSWYTAKGGVPGTQNISAQEQIYLYGVPPDTQMFFPNLVSGRNLLPADGHALLLNQKLAKDLGLTVGDLIELNLNSGTPTRWTIVGLVLDINGDQKTAYLNRDVLNRELGQVGRGYWVEVQGWPKTLAGQQAIAKDLETFLKAQGIRVSSTDTAQESQQQASAQFATLTTVLMIMTILIASVGSIGLSGTLSINVLERRREIGVMRAVGASSIDVSFIFMGEGLLLGLISWLSAIPLSLLAGEAFVKALSQVIDFPATYYYSVNGVWIWLIIVVVLSLIASWLPALRATQISVQQSLAYE